MFSKKTCNRCGRKTNKNNKFCPKCGFPLNKNNKKEEFGILGESDSFTETDSFSNSLIGGIGGNFMNKMISNTIRMMEKEMEREMRRANKNNKKDDSPRTKIKLMINGKEINLGEDLQSQEQKKEKQKTPQIKFNNFSESQIKKFSKLSKKEPKTELRRLADKIVYEIEIPGVKSLEDISIINLEESIEFKAISDKNAYSKSIPLNLPIVGYKLSKDIVTLEFKEN